MRIISLEVENFKRLKGSREFQFPLGIIGITGPNGQGKSTVGAAIAWTFFGPDMLPTGKADVVTWGEKECKVAVNFEINDTMYRCMRKQSKGGTSDAQLLVHDSITYSAVARGIDPTNREIERLFGVDRVGFLTSVYARQEELTGLMSLTPANRIKTVLRLLGIEQLTSAIENVRAEARDARKSLEEYRVGSERVEDVEKTIYLLEDHIQQAKADISEKEDQLAQKKAEITSLVNESAKLIPQRKAYEQYRERLGKAQIAFAGAEAELRGAERAYEAIKTANEPGPEPEPVDEAHIRELELNLGAIRRETQDLTERNENIKKHSKCFACDRPFDHAADAELQVAENTKRLEILLQQDQDIYDELSILRNDNLRRKQWELAKFAYDQYIEKRDIALDRIGAARVEIAKAQEQRLRVQADDPGDDISATIEEIQQKRLDAEIAAGQIRESLATLAEIRKTHDTNLETAKRRYEAARNVADAVKAMEHAVLLKETTATELSALKERMIGQLIPMLSERASSLVNRFTDGRYTEVLITNDYEIQYRNELGEQKSFQNLSGGEKDVFALAVRLAIAELRADSIGVLLLDEILESLDADRQEATWATIERLTKRYQQIFVITHVQAFKDRAATVISI